MLLLAVFAADPAAPARPLAGSPNAALVAALSSQNEAAGRARVAELLSPPKELVEMARSLGLPASALVPAAVGAAPSCSKSAQLINSAADLMATLRQPEAQKLMMEKARDERALRWVMERTRESLADPGRFLELLASPLTASLLTALRADAGLLPQATTCSADGDQPQPRPAEAAPARTSASPPSANRTSTNRTE